MADPDLRQLERAAQQDPALRAQYFQTLARLDPAFAAVETPILALLARVRAAETERQERSIDFIDESHRLPELDPAPLVPMLDGIGADLEQRLLFAGPLPSVIALATRDGDRVHLGVRATWGPATPAAWASLKRYRPDARPSTLEEQRWRWLEREADLLALELPAVQRWIQARWTLCGRPPAPVQAKTLPRAPRKRLARLDELRRRCGLQDDEALAELLRDEGWSRPIAELDAPWVDIAIELLEERVGERFDRLPEEPLTQADEGGPTDRQLDLLRSLKARHRLSDDAFRALAAEIGYTQSFAHLDKEWASRLIDRLKRS